MYCQGSNLLEAETLGPPAVMECPMPDDSPLRTKWTQVRRDQQSALDELAREIQDSKSRRGGERITANTLIRIGIDVVLSQGDRLAGDTEQEIRSGLFELLGIAGEEGGTSAMADGPHL